MLLKFSLFSKSRHTFVMLEWGNQKQCMTSSLSNSYDCLKNLLNSVNYFLPSLNTTVVFCMLWISKEKKILRTIVRSMSVMFYSTKRSRIINKTIIWKFFLGLGWCIISSWFTLFHLCKKIYSCCTYNFAFKVCL